MTVLLQVRVCHDEETMNEPLRIDDRHARLPDGPGRGVQPSAGIAGRVR